MVRIRVLSGRTAGTTFVARRFPVRIGRSPESDLKLEEDGVWDRHLELHLKAGSGFELRALPDALARVNGNPALPTALRNGDIIELGAAKLQFWLGDPRLRGQRLREWATWIGIAAVCAGQLWLVYWLLGF